jgi:hypothetical protein
MVVPALETDIEAEGPCLTIVDSGAEARPALRQSLAAVWLGLSAPARWLIIAAVVLSLGLITAATVYRVVSAPPAHRPDPSSVR